MRIEQLYEIFLRFPKISTDTRSIQENSIFFCLKGDNFDGNKFANEALKNGARYAVVDDKNLSENDNHVYVDDSLICLQKLAQHHRQQLSIPVLAITGTNGKTTTKELITAVLSEKYKVTSTTGNLNNHIGVPLTLLRLSSETEIAIIEMGANHVGEIAALCNIAQPNHGLVTNIGKAHLEGFGSFDGVVKAKRELYQYLTKAGGTIFINSDNGLLNDLIKGYICEYYGSDTKSDLFGQITGSDPYLELEFFDRSDDILQPYQISTKLTGVYNFENVMAAVKAGVYFNVEKDKIIKSIENHFPRNNRSQMMKTEDNHLVIDAYNANPSSMVSSILNFSKMQGEKKCLILGDMLELGKYTEEEHSKIIDLVGSMEWEKVMLVGKEFQKLTAPSGFDYFEDVNSLIKYLKATKIQNSTILIKGSRGIKLEETIQYL